ncbi:MAG: metallophosphoesterase [Ignavibacteriae bacterium]|nr:metallophosphoesterase [Ignavibacteriota bacterium]
MSGNDIIGIIGDIHGCLKTLRSVYRKLARYTEDIYTVGDLIDRGPDSKDVVQFCIDNGVKSTRGNHEDMMLNAIEHPTDYNIFMHMQNGGKHTAKSYTGRPDSKDYDFYFNRVKLLGHFDYLKHLPLSYEFPKVIISHAGIIEGGDRETILWNKTILPQKLEKLQVIGHTPYRSYIYHEDYYANIDTGCVYDNKLTGIIVDIHSGKVLNVAEEYCKD